MTKQTTKPIISISQIFILTLAMTLLVSAAEITHANPSAFDSSILESLKTPEPPLPRVSATQFTRGQVTLDPARVRVETRDERVNTLQLFIDGVLIKTYDGPTLRRMKVMTEIRDYYSNLLSQMQKKGRKVTVDLDYGPSLFLNHSGKGVIVPSDEETIPHEKLIEAVQALSAENAELKRAFETRDQNP